MNYIRFQLACEKLKKLPGFEMIGGKSKIDIEKAELALGLSFSPQCLNFYQRIDYVSYDGGEIFGISDGANSMVLEGNIVAYTLYDREHYNMPLQWIPFYNFYDGSLAYFDYSQINEYGEPCVIRAYYNEKKQEFTIIEVLAQDFGEFLEILIDWNLDG